METWKPILNNEFEVSNIGKVRRYGSKRIIRPFTNYFKNKPRYMIVSLWIKSKKKCVKFLVHRLVMIGFVGPRPKKSVISHINHDKLDNRVENLEYVTQSRNLIGSFRDGKKIIRFTTKDILRIRFLYKIGVTPKELGLIYSTTPQYAHRVANSRAWKWLD